jgi:hypothetical protein
VAVISDFSRDLSITEHEVLAGLWASLVDFIPFGTEVRDLTKW